MLLQNVFKEDSSAPLPQLSSEENPNSELAKVTRERNRLRDQLNKVTNLPCKIDLDRVHCLGRKSELQAPSIILSHALLVSIL